MNEPQIDPYSALLSTTSAKRREDWSLDDWVVGLHSIYGDRNASKSPNEHWLQVSNDASQLSEEVRKGNLEIVVQEAVKIFGRTCSFVGKYLYQQNFSPGDPINTLLRHRGANDLIGGPESYGKWVLEKYPWHCGTCWETVCVCSASRRIMENRSKYPDRYEQVTKGRHEKIAEVTKALSHTNNEPSQAAKNFLNQPLDKLIDTFFAIYGGSQFDVELWKIAAHLMEEIGEVANEILYLSDLLQAASDNVNFGTGMKEAYERALRSEGGLDESIQQKLSSTIENDPQEALAYFKAFVVQTMRGELGDVISWLSALLWKIGETWRASRVLAPGEQPPYYKFCGYVSAGYTGVQNNLACKFCGEVECQPGCRSVRLFKNVAEKMSKSYRAGDPAVKTTLGA